VSTGTAVALFHLGLFFVFMAYLAAFVLPIVLGYLMAITALAVGIYMAVKRGGRILPLILGVILAYFSLMALAALALAPSEYHYHVEIKKIEIRHSA